MRSDKPEKEPIRTGKKTGIWLALAVALFIHIVFLFVPLTRNLPVAETTWNSIELHLTTDTSQVNAVPEKPLTEPRPDPPPEVKTVPELPVTKHEDQAAPVTVLAETPVPKTVVMPLKQRLKLDDMSEPEKKRLTNSILARQFVTEQSAADKLFGKHLLQDSTAVQKAFHYPEKLSMITILDRPVPDMPFSYEPGLVHFAYEPGVKGDLQRFWDVITPEFGWRTKYGTEVRCVVVLVILGCGWK